jgi:hypothetical protein
MTTGIPGLLRIDLDVQPNDDGWFRAGGDLRARRRAGALYVPRGCGNSFCTLEPHTVYNFLVNEHWSPERLTVDLFDPELAIEWPFPREQLRHTERDAANPSLDSVRSARA